MCGGGGGLEVGRAEAQKHYMSSLGMGTETRYLIGLGAKL